MAGIVNKVYLLPVLSRVSGVGVVGCEDGCRAFCKKKKKNRGVCWGSWIPSGKESLEL